MSVKDGTPGVSQSVLQLLTVRDTQLASLDRCAHMYMSSLARTDDGKDENNTCSVTASRFLSKVK